MPPQGPPPGGMAAHASERADALHQYIFSLPADKFQGKPWDLMRAIEDFADTQRLPMIFRENKMSLVRAALAAMDPKPKTIIEFGTFVGVSTIGWGASLKELNPGATDIHVYGFEMEPKQAQIARDLVKLAGLQDIVTVLEGPGAESLKKLHAEGKIKPGEVDMVFIDHWEKFYKPDLQLCEELKLFHVGSLAVADNTDFPGAPEYAAYVKGGGSGESGAVQYESQSLVAAGEGRGPKIVEVSKVIAI